MILRPCLWFAILGTQLLSPAFGAAQSLDLPGTARLVHEELSPGAAYAMPVGPWADGRLPVRVTEGIVSRQVWQLAAPDLGLLALGAALRDQLRDQLHGQDFDILLDCAAPACGGFDFRFATEVLPPPAMHVDLSAFHFLGAEREGRAGVERAGILISSAGDLTYVQVIRVSSAADTAASVAAAPPPDGSPGPGTVTAAFDPGQLVSQGRVILSGVVFPSASAEMDGESPESLRALADWLRADPARRVALVGHTDAQGGLEGNIALSRRRAQSVLDHLAVVLGVPRSQMQAEGMGWLSPVASNQTGAGREANRRVEAVLLSIEE